MRRRKQAGMFESIRKKYLIYLKGGIHKRRRPETGHGAAFLIIQFDSLGDVCTLLPVIRKLKERGYTLNVLCREDLAPLWRYFFPDLQIFTIARDSWSPDILANTTARLKGLAYEAIFAVTISPLAAYLAAFVPASRRYGMIERRYFKGARWLYDAVYPAEPNEFIIRRFIGLFSLHIPEFYSVQIGDGILEPVTGGEYILVHPGGKWKPRRWPAERFLRVANELARAGYPVRILVHESEKDLLAAFRDERLVRGASVWVTRTIADLIRAVKKGILLLGNDSGPVHLAKLFGLPAVVLWGPGNSARIHPLGTGNIFLRKDVPCRPCRQYIHPERCEQGENICLQKITVQEVLEAVSEQLNDPGPSFIPPDVK